MTVMKISRPYQSQGVTIIEMMVAMVIGMMLMAVIASVLATSEGSKRSQTGVNDISQAGNYAAFILDQWIRAAGSGFNQTAARSYGCPLQPARAALQSCPCHPVCRHRLTASARL